MCMSNRGFIFININTELYMALSFRNGWFESHFICLQLHAFHKTNSMLSIQNRLFVISRSSNHPVSIVWNISNENWIHQELWLRGSPKSVFLFLCMECSKPIIANVLIAIFFSKCLRIEDCSYSVNGNNVKPNQR